MDKFFFLTNVFSSVVSLNDWQFSEHLRLLAYIKLFSTYLPFMHQLAVDILCDEGEQLRPGIVWQVVFSSSGNYLGNGSAHNLPAMFHKLQ